MVLLLLKRICASRAKIDALGFSLISLSNTAKSLSLIIVLTDLISVRSFASLSFLADIIGL